MFYSYYRLYTTAYTRGRAVTKKTGPNDAGHVVWAKSESFFITNYNILTLEYKMPQKEGGYEANGPKRR